MGIVILGAGGHACSIIDLIDGLSNTNLSDEIELLDDHVLKNSAICGKRITGDIKDCLNYPDLTKFVIGIGDNRTRKMIANQYHLPFVTLIHPSAIIGKHVEIGDGSVVMAGAIVNAESTIGSHCIINTGATVDHENQIADFVHISPGVNLGGRVMVGEGSWIGIGSCVMNDIKIGKQCTIGAGAVVIRDVPDGSTVVGNPARLIKGRN